MVLIKRNGEGLQPRNLASETISSAYFHWERNFFWVILKLLHRENILESLNPSYESTCENMF